jgi:alcohol dehydrogenase
MRVQPPRHPAGADGDWAAAAIGAVREVSGAIDVKRPLRELRVDRDMLPSIAAVAVADAVTANAPLFPSGAEVLRILESVY